MFFTCVNFIMLLIRSNLKKSPSMYTLNILHNMVAFIYDTSGVEGEKNANIMKPL